MERGSTVAPVAKKGYLLLEELVSWSGSVSPQILSESFCVYPHWELTGLMADLKLERLYLDGEFVARLADKPLSTELILLDWEGLDRRAEVEKLLEVNKIKWGRPREQSVEDIKQSTWAKALEVWRQPSHEFWRLGNDELSTPLPNFPGFPYIKMFPCELEFWHGPMTRAWQEGKRVILKGLLPVFAGREGKS